MQASPAAPVTDGPGVVAVPTRRAAVAGVLAAGLTLGVAHLVAVPVGPGSSPLVAVGGAVVDRTPAWLKDLAIATFGVNDKTVLFVVMALVIAGVAAGIGVVARDRPRWGTALVLLLGLVGALAAGARQQTLVAVVPSLVGALVGTWALHRLLEQATEPQQTALTRRRFLGAALAVGAVAAVAAVAGAALEGVGRATVALRESVRLPRAARRAAALPAGVASSTPGVVPFVTPNGEFYRIDTALTIPRVDPATWQLRVHGMVDREVVLGFDELLAEDLVETWVTLACVSNPVGGELISNAKWLGLPVRTLLERAGVRPGADMVLSTSVDGFTASTPLGALTDDRDAILAVGMNDEPLPFAHGFPVRMVVPGLYGYVSATKWLVDLEVTRFADREAYWTVRGWSERGPVKTSSRLEVPRAGASVPAGEVAVGGTAWAQHTGIIKVEVQVDDGPWAEVDLADEATVDTWRQWSWTWQAEPGEHTLRTRATDATGTLQTEQEAGVVPDGATGWHSVQVSVSP